MNPDSGEHTDINDVNDLTPAEARKKREYLLALAKKTTHPEEDSAEDIDSADSTMATLILPGG